MEEILDLYERPYNPRRPVVCLDEFSIELHDEKVLPLQMEPGKEKKEDYEYIRKGVCSVFVVVEPLAGKRWAIVSRRRGKRECIEVLRKIVEEWYEGKEIEKIELVMDNLSTHRMSLFYEYLAAERARENVKKMEVHYTPVHASWLNMAEIEIGALMTQSLRRRIKSEEMLKEELEACVEIRNKEKRKINWEFTTVKAREKLGKHYPKVPHEYVQSEFILRTL